MTLTPPSSRLGGGFTSISDSLLAGDTATFDFQAIASTYTSLLVVVYARSDVAAANDELGVRFNNDSGANYYNLALFGTNATVTAGPAVGTTTGRAGYFSANTATASRFGSIMILIPNYAQTTGHKSASSIHGMAVSNVAAGQTAGTNGFHWANTAAISRVTLLPVNGTVFRTGSRATLYGIT